MLEDDRGVKGPKKDDVIYEQPRTLVMSHCVWPGVLKVHRAGIKIIELGS